MASITLNEQNQSEFEARLQDIKDLVQQVEDAVQEGESFDADDVLFDLDTEMDGARLDLIAIIQDIVNGDLDNSPDED